jgi:hypothetical protein
LLVEDRDNRQASLPITFGEMSALLAVAAVGIYVLGLIALWVPIARYYTQDFAQSWYAVALVPRTVVAGQGIKVLLEPIVVVAVTGMLALLFDFLQSYFNRLIAVIIIGVLLVVVLIGFFSLSPYIPSFWDIPVEFRVPWLNRLSIAIVVVLTLVAATVNASVLMNGLTVLGQEVGTGRTLKSVVIVFVLSFASGLIQAVGSNPPLPQVTVEGTTTTEGALLTHVDRFWYVFDQTSTLISIPDSEITEVRISSSE